MAKRGIDEHPKTIEFAELLSIPPCYAVGVLELFWHWVAKYRPQGDIEGTKPSAIAHAIRFPGTGKQLVEALVGAGFIDVEGGRSLVHDWSEHADNSVHAALKKRGETFADGHEPYTRNQVRQAKKEGEVHQQDTNRLQTTACEFTNGSRSPARTWPEPEPEPDTSAGEEGEEGASAAPIFLDGQWAPLGHRLDSPEIRGELSRIEANRRAKRPRPLGPVPLGDVQILVSVIEANGVDDVRFLAFLRWITTNGWASAKADTMMRFLRENPIVSGSGYSGSNPDRAAAPRRKPRSQWTPEEIAAHEAELAEAEELARR